jgi:CheY-like chemotaxis protein
MPEMTGFDFLNEYQNLPENIRKKCIIMMLTTSLDENDRKLAEANVFVQRFLNKPLDREKIVSLLQHPE